MEQRPPRAEIKWIRLQEICWELAGRKKIIHVHGSTEAPPDLRAGVTMEGDRVDILMNLLYNKCLEDVIDSLAHEMAHIVIDDEGHGPEFERAWAEVRKKITSEYERLERERRPGQRAGLSGPAASGRRRPGRDSARRRP